MGGMPCTARATDRWRRGRASHALDVSILQTLRESVAPTSAQLSVAGGTSGARSPGMLMPAVDRYMTREPYSIASTDSLARARAMMTKHQIRHLPVVDGAHLVGVISDRDVDVVDAVPGIDLGRVEIGRVMRPPLDVWGETPLDEVSELMTTERSDCVVVRGGHGVEGIFTAVDALSALADLLRRATS
jgi:acetoin utilization protein AcuB